MAVAIKNHGYDNIKIYNGGVKDWRNAGLPLASIEPLPKYECLMISSEELIALMQGDCGCRDARGQPILTILDFRTENSQEDPGEGFKRLDTACPVVYGLLDDLRSPEFRTRIPSEGLVVTVTETGNRDQEAMRYLSKFGYTNVKGLDLGMRGWIKNKFPIK